MKKTLKIIALLGLSILPVSQASANLIVNGSFENPNLGSGWSTYASIPGWTSVGAYQIEIGLGGVYGVTGYDGRQVMELDSYGNVLVDQILAIPGGNYTLSFLYADRSGTAPASATFDVYWNNVLVSSFSPTSTVMSLFSTTVAALPSNTLEFRGTGTQDSYGAIIDNVQLNAVPEPTTMIAGALLLLPFGVSTLRMLRKKTQTA